MALSEKTISMKDLPLKDFKDATARRIAVEARSQNKKRPPEPKKEDSSSAEDSGSFICLKSEKKLKNLTHTSGGEKR